MIDTVSLIYYGLICGCLAAVAPSFGPRVWRAGWGLAVGAVAVFIFPWLRASLGI